MKKILYCILGITALGCVKKTEKMEKELREFIARHEQEAVPVIKAANLAFWEASISGKEEDYRKVESLQHELVKIYSNKEHFSVLQKIRSSNSVKDSLLQRQLTLLYNAFLKSMADTALLQEIVSMEVEIEKKYSNFRAEWDGKKYTDNEIEEILSTSLDNELLKKAWTAHKAIGRVVCDDIRKLVKKRNQLAVSLGFPDYHTMSLTLSEQNPAEIEKIFDELDSLTSGAFDKVKKEIDDYLAARLHISADSLMPWHYQNRFFQEAPAIYKTDLDKFYKDKDLIELTRRYYHGIGLHIQDIIERSDLFEKPGKNQHAYCIDIDNEGDVRVLCNLASNARWMNTMLHEYGHAVYDKYIDSALPYFLRDPAHTFTTEAVAMLFGRMASNPKWMLDMGIISGKTFETIKNDCADHLRLEQLVFSRWAQVMYRFEKEMYANPDQDLNALWWKLVEKYQKLRKPEGRDEPDWAAKIHIATSPCYYHNYLLGELLASQLYYYIAEHVLRLSAADNVSFAGRQEVGRYLIEKVFSPGSRYVWNEMIKKATGEELTPVYYARQFIR